MRKGFKSEHVCTEHLTISPKHLFENFFDQTEEIRTCIHRTVNDFPKTSFFFNERIYIEQLTIFPKHLFDTFFDQTEEIRTCTVSRTGLS